MGGVEGGVALEAAVAGEDPVVSPLTATPPTRPVSGPMSCDLYHRWVQLEIGAMSVPSAEGHFPDIAARKADHAPLLPGFLLLAGSILDPIPSCLLVFFPKRNCPHR